MFAANSLKTLRASRCVRMFGGMDNIDRMRTMMGENVTEERTEQTDRPCFSALTSEAELWVF